MDYKKISERCLKLWALIKTKSRSLKGLELKNLNLEKLKLGRININWKRLNRVKPLTVSVALGVSLLAVLTIMLFTTSKEATAIMVNGKTLAVAKDKQVIDGIIRDILAEKNNKSGMSVGFADVITYKKVQVSNLKINNLPSLKKKLNDNLEFTSLAAVIRINEKPEISLANKKIAQQVLNNLKKGYLEQLKDVQVDSYSYLDKVEIVETKVDLDKVLDADDALALLRNGRNKKVVHVVKQGDSLWTIARSNDMRVKQIMAANPQMKSDRLDLGQEINLVKVEPLLNVVVDMKATVTEEIPFQTKVQQNNKMRKDQEKILQSGAPGSKTVTYKIVLRNGSEVERQVLATNITQKPKDQLVARGPRKYAMVASRGGLGKFIWPLRGGINSPFGWRWGRPHTGVDIEGDTGDPVGASAAGRVVRASWYSGYGKTVDIAHGNGYVTRYAHLSSIAVKVGEQVDKGELIGKVGTTGNTTGSCLHFEVITGGDQVNPLKYLR